MLEIDTTNGIVKVQGNIGKVINAALEDIRLARDNDLSNHIPIAIGQLERSIDELLSDLNDPYDSVADNISSDPKSQITENDNFYNISQDVEDNMTKSPSVDDKVKIYWPDDDKIYSCRVEGVSEHGTTHNILYDDGKKETLDLRNEIWKCSDHTAVQNNVVKVTDWYFKSESEKSLQDFLNCLEK